MIKNNQIKTELLTALKGLELNSLIFLGSLSFLRKKINSLEFKDETIYKLKSTRTASVMRKSLNDSGLMFQVGRNRYLINPFYLNNVNSFKKTEIEILSRKYNSDNLLRNLMAATIEYTYGRSKELDKYLCKYFE